MLWAACRGDGVGPLSIQSPFAAIWTVRAVELPIWYRLEEVKSTVGGKAAGGGVVRKRAPSLQQEDQAERHSDRGAASGVLREAQHSPQEEDHGGAQAAGQAGLIGPLRPPVDRAVGVGCSRHLTKAERRLARDVDLTGLLGRALHDLGLEGSAVSCQLLTAAEVRALNLRFAGLDEATDVLAFPAAEAEPGSGFQMPPGAAALLGDIVISVETAVAQAAAAGDDPLSELRLLAVHGLLHLLGHDHDLAPAAQRMTSATRQLLARDAARRGVLPPRVPPLQPPA